MGFTELLTSVDVSVRRTLRGNESITYTPTDGDPVDVIGIFSNADGIVDTGTPGVMAPALSVFLRLSELPSDPETDVDAKLTVDGVDYVQHECLKDGLGGVTLRLHLDA